MTHQNNRKHNTVIPWTAMLLSVIAIALAATAIFRPAPNQNKTNTDYDRIVAEVWGVVEANYDNMGIEKPDQPPRTLSEALRPLLELVQPIVSDSSDP